MSRRLGLEVGPSSLGALGVLAVILATFLAEPVASAQPHPPRPRPAALLPSLADSLPPDARRDYDAGKLLFEDGDYATALLKYQAAFDRTQDPRLLWNVAVCQKDQRHYAKAAATLARYLAEGGDRLSAVDRHDALELSRAIAPFTVPTVIQVSEPGAQIWIDDALVGQSPLQGLVALDMGTRRVRVTKDGFRLYEREFPVGGSAATTIEVTLERQGGHLQLNVSADATVWVDEQAAGHGPRVEIDLPVGAHAMRVTAPRMRPLQTDVVVEDGKSRALDLALETAAAAAGDVHVAVSCEGPDPLPPDSLAVFFDDATESALPLGSRVRREPAHEVVAYVAYRVPPGHHLVHVASSRCQAQDAVVDVPEGGVADVTGALAPLNPWLEGSPAGSPDGWRLAVGLMESSPTFSQFQHFFSASSGLGQSGIGNVGTTLVGPTASAGLQNRWLTALVDARFQLTRVTGTAEVAGSAVPYDSTLSQWSVGVRPGVRLPLVVAAVSTGVGLHAGQYSFAPDTAGSSKSGSFLSASYWAALDAQPLCEWGLQFGASVSYDSYGGISGGVSNNAVTSLWLQATYTPNTTCNRRRAGLLRIEGTTR
jgi:PEGA domain